MRYADSPSNCTVCKVKVREGRTRCPDCRRIPFVCKECGLETLAKSTGKYPDKCPVCTNACSKCGKAIATRHLMCSDCRDQATTCVTCKERFSPKGKGKIPKNCPECTIKRKLEVGRLGSRLKSEERRVNHLLNREKCKDCGKTLPLRKTKQFEYCEECLPKMRKVYEEKRRNRLKTEDPNFDKRRDLKKHYGITLEAYNDLFTQQSKKCGICKSNVSGGKGWHVDHDHETGAVRGILCHFCNLALGHFKDNPEIMNKAIKYLIVWEKSHG